MNNFAVKLKTSHFYLMNLKFILHSESLHEYMKISPMRNAQVYKQSCPHLFPSIAQLFALADHKTFHCLISVAVHVHIS